MDASISPSSGGSNGGGFTAALPHAFKQESPTSEVNQDGINQTNIAISKSSSMRLLEVKEERPSIQPSPSVPSTVITKESDKISPTTIAALDDESHQPSLPDNDVTSPVPATSPRGIDAQRLSPSHRDNNKIENLPRPKDQDQLKQGLEEENTMVATSAASSPTNHEKSIVVTPAHESPASKKDLTADEYYYAKIKCFTLAKMSMPNGSLLRVVTSEGTMHEEPPPLVDEGSNIQSFLLPKNPMPRGRKRGMAATRFCKKRNQSKEKKKSGNQKIPFPVSVHMMVSETAMKNPDIIRWVEDGEAFVVDSMHPSLGPLLMQYFDHSKFSSFQRQLNMYGWSKHKEGRFSGAFYNPHFHRDRGDPEDLSCIIRGVGCGPPRVRRNQYCPGGSKSRQHSLRTKCRQPKAVIKKSQKSKKKVSGNTKIKVTTSTVNPSRRNVILPSVSLRQKTKKIVYRQFGRGKSLEHMRKLHQASHLNTGDYSDPFESEEEQTSLSDDSSPIKVLPSLKRQVSPNIGHKVQSLKKSKYNNNNSDAQDVAKDDAKSGNPSEFPLTTTFCQNRRAPISPIQCRPFRPQVDPRQQYYSRTSESVAGGVLSPVETAGVRFRSTFLPSNRLSLRPTQNSYRDVPSISVGRSYSTPMSYPPVSYPAMSPTPFSNRPPSFKDFETFVGWTNELFDALDLSNTVEGPPHKFKPAEKHSKRI